MPNRTNQTRHSLEVTSAASLYPVTLDELKAHLRFTESEDDALLVDAIKEATEKLEEDTRRQFMNATVAEYYDYWPFDAWHQGRDVYLWHYSASGPSVAMQVHRAPLVSVSSITYTDTEGNTQTWGSGNYTVDAKSEPGRITVAYNGAVPAARVQTNSITVTYVAGYGTSRGNVPRRAKRGILMYAGALYDGRCMAPEEQFAWNSIVSGLQWGL